MSTTEKIWLTGEPGRNYQRKHRRLSLIKLAIVLIVIVVLYGMLVAPRLVQITNHDVALSNLPEELNGLRVVQVSDVHCGFFFRDRSVARIVELMNTCKPDIVVLTGDFINRKATKYIPSLEQFRNVKATLGTYACLGNHDNWENAKEVTKTLEDAGVRVLFNESAQPAKGLTIAGIDDMISGKPDLQKTHQRIPKTDAVILISHNPAILSKVAQEHWVVLAGHTHGGQIALPILGPRRTGLLPVFKQLKRWNETTGAKRHSDNIGSDNWDQYTAGWYEEGNARLYVNRGVGQNQSLSMRLNCRPEIACFTLHSKE